MLIVGVGGGEQEPGAGRVAKGCRVLANKARHIAKPALDVNSLCSSSLYFRTIVSLFEARSKAGKESKRCTTKRKAQIIL
jgi:hypothetical protein